MTDERVSSCPDVKIDNRKRKMLHVVSAVFTFVNGLDQRTVLLTRNEEGLLTLPGGKMEVGETETEALDRELKEELPNINTNGGRFRWDYFVIGTTPTSKRRVKADIYLFEGVININNPGERLFGREIKGIEFFDLNPNKIRRSKEITQVTKKALLILLNKFENKAKSKSYKIAFSLDKISTQG
jgi:8-oxo-dGTP pyrophosphatase MutT (NUDIX family)